MIFRYRKCRLKMPWFPCHIYKSLGDLCREDTRTNLSASRPKMDRLKWAERFESLSFFPARILARWDLMGARDRPDSGIMNYTPGMCQSPSW